MDWARSVEGRAAAKDLFGRPSRVVVASWVLSQLDQPFFLQQAQDALAAVGEARTAVSQELQLMKRYGMLDSYHDGRRVYFVQVKDNSYWGAFEAINAALATAQPWPREGTDSPADTTTGRLMESTADPAELLRRG